MKKFHFELWWLWIPVVVFSFFKMMASNELSIFSGGLYSSLFVLSFLGIGFRPRKPLVIYSHLNSMLRRVFWVMSITMLVLLWSMFLAAAQGVFPPDWLIAVVVVIVAGIAMLVLVWLVYWSHPYSRKRSGVAAVDAAIERYRKPGEQVGGAWMAPVVIDGRRYYGVTYYRSGEQLVIREIAFGEDGSVVKDEALMHKFAQGNRLGWNIANPEYANLRAKTYKDLGKGVQIMTKLVFPRWGRWLQAIGPRYAQEMEAVKQALQLHVTLAYLMQERYYREAEWGMQHGNTKLREVRYEEVEGLNRQDKVFAFLVKNLETLDRGTEAALKLQQVLGADLGLRKKVKDFWYVLEHLADFSDRILEVRRYLARGEEELAYPGLLPIDKERWRARLAWVELVDSWVAQGYTGQALEAKKREYLEGEERARKEREREERRRRREERARRRAEREAQRAVQEQAEATEGQR